MKKNNYLRPCYYWDGKNLVEYKKIRYCDYLDYSERLYDKGFVLYRIGYGFYIFRLGQNAGYSY